MLTDVVERTTEQNVAFLKRCGDNDLGPGEFVRVSPWVARLPSADQLAILRLVVEYDAWAPETDPTGTKAAGIVRFKGHYIPWGIAWVRRTVPGILLMPLNEPVEHVLIIKHSSEVL